MFNSVKIAFHSSLCLVFCIIKYFVWIYAFAVRSYVCSLQKENKKTLDMTYAAKYVTSTTQATADRSRAFIIW